MSARVLWRLVLSALLGVTLISVGRVLTASTLVPESGLEDDVVQDPITANDLKPPECSGLNLSNIVEGSGTFGGTAGNDLILGGTGADIIDGGGGDDCILGGDAGDELLGGPSIPETVRDEFNAVSYGNNDGTRNWSGDWGEIGESDGPVSGDVNVEMSVGVVTYTVGTDQDSWVNQRRANRNYGNAANLNVRLRSGRERRALFRFDLSAIPADATVNAATAYLWVTLANGNPITAHRITAAWTEGAVTWNNIAADFDSTPVGSFTPATAGQFVALDITPLAQDWVGGASPNHGLTLIGTVNNAATRYASRETAGTGQDPFLEIVFTPGPSAQALRIQNSNMGARRGADLSGATAAELQFEYRRHELDDGGDYVAVEVSATGGAPWTELGRFAGPADDGPGMLPASYDLTSYISAATAIRFIGSPSLGASDRLYVDNVEIGFTGPDSDGGDDVLLGGPADDVLNGGGGIDVCTGGPGSDTYDPSCEVQN